MLSARHERVPRLSLRVTRVLNTKISVSSCDIELDRPVGIETAHVRNYSYYGRATAATGAGKEQDLSKLGTSTIPRVRGVEGGEYRGGVA